MAQGQPSVTSPHDYITSAINPKYHGRAVIIIVVTIIQMLQFTTIMNHIGHIDVWQRHTPVAVIFTSGLALSRASITPDKPWYMAIIRAVALACMTIKGITYNYVS